MFWISYSWKKLKAALTLQDLIWVGTRACRERRYEVLAVFTATEIPFQKIPIVTSYNCRHVPVKQGQCFCAVVHTSVVLNYKCAVLILKMQYWSSEYVKMSSMGDHGLFSCFPNKSYQSFLSAPFIKVTWPFQATRFLMLFWSKCSGSKAFADYK